MNIEKYIDEKFKDLNKLINAKFDGNAEEHSVLHKELNKKASRWVQVVVSTGIGIMLIWGLQRLLELISTAHAIFFN